MPATKVVYQTRVRSFQYYSDVAPLPPKQQAFVESIGARGNAAVQSMARFEAARAATWLSPQEQAGMLAAPDPMPSPVAVQNAVPQPAREPCALCDAPQWGDSPCCFAHVNAGRYREPLWLRALRWVVS